MPISGDRAAAVAAYDRLWPSPDRILGPDHPTTLSIRHNYTDFQDWADNRGREVAAYQELLGTYTRILAPDYPATAMTAAALEVQPITPAEVACGILVAAAVAQIPAVRRVYGIALARIVRERAL